MVRNHSSSALCFTAAAAQKKSSLFQHKFFWILFYTTAEGDMREISNPRELTGFASQKWDEQWTITEQELERCEANRSSRALGLTLLEQDIT